MAAYRQTFQQAVLRLLAASRRKSSVIDRTADVDPELPVTNVCYAEVQRPVWAAVLEKHLGDMTYVEALGTSVP